MLLFLDHIEIVNKFVEFLLTHKGAQIDYKGEGERLEHILVQIFTKFHHIEEDLVFGRNQGMILEMIDQVALTVLAKEVKFDLARYRGPLKLIQCLAGLDLGPAGTRFHHSFHHLVIVAPIADPFVEFTSHIPILLFVQRQKIIFGLNFSFLLNLRLQFLLLLARFPHWLRVILFPFVDTAHPL